MLRPSDAPRLIPAWAWARIRWFKTGGPRPGPAKLPAWFWDWFRWRKSLAVTPEVTMYMYDDVNVSLIPKDAQAVAGYVNGKYVTYPKLLAAFPHALHVSIAVTASADADVLDVERGDAEIWQVPNWVKRQQKRGLAKPGVYCSVSDLPALLAELKRNGVERTSVRIWTAHYTGKPHRCTKSACGYDFAGQADATQYTDRALGRSLDESLVGPTFFNL